MAEKTNPIKRPTNNTRFHQGFFRPEHPEKYRGDVSKIVYRSSWEKQFMIKYCDQNDNCLLWSSEEIAIPYFNPIDQKAHKYYIDFFCVLRQGDSTQGVFVEIKPENEQKKPVMPGQLVTEKRLTTYNEQMRNYIKNLAKWEAAKQFAEQRNMKFLVINEYDLGIKQRSKQKTKHAK